MASPEEKKQDSGAQPLAGAPASAPNPASKARRDFLRASLGAGIVLLIAGVASVGRVLLAPPVAEADYLSSEESTTTTASYTGSVPPATTPGFPVVLVATVSSLEPLKPMEFNYPLEETPTMLVKLGVPAERGVGPDGDIVAFSNICQHLGCIWGFVPIGGSPPCNASYTAAQSMGYCCCHGSQYNLEEEAKVIGGPAPHPVPQVTLFVDPSGNIWATGMEPGAVVIFGYGPSGSTDLSLDLQGGTLVQST